MWDRISLIRREQTEHEVRPRADKIRFSITNYSIRLGRQKMHFPSDARINLNTYMSILKMNN